MKYSKEVIQQQIKPLSGNGFVAFWQKLYRGYLGWWVGFCDKHPKGSKLLKEFVVMFLFSNLVTIWQALVMIFLPYAFKAIWDVPFVWPALALPWKDGVGNPLNYAIFNEPVKFLMLDGSIALASTKEQVALFTLGLGKLQMSGLGNFIAFEIAVFTAQCINFPLQRNITFKSKGNPWIQAIWYFIGWVGISVGVNAVWGIINPLLLWWDWADWIIALIKTFITGGVSMIVFFPIFKIIFPDIHKEAEKQREKYNKMVEAGVAADALAAQLAKTEKLEAESKKLTLEQNAAKATSLASNKALRYFALNDSLEKAEATEVEAIQAKIDAAYEEVCVAIEEKEKALEAAKN